jgi:hypothetical protein
LLLGIAEGIRTKVKTWCVPAVALKPSKY